jgi:hypothetical protein
MLNRVGSHANKYLATGCTNESLLYAQEEQNGA